jgi:outer membrane protein assembly factor BamB
VPGPTCGALRAFAALALVAAAAGLAACGSDTVKPSPLTEFRATAQIRSPWRASVGDAKPYLFTPALSQGSIYAASHDGTLARFDAEKGKQVWRVNTGYKLSGGVGADAGLVMVGSEKGVVLAYGPNGKLVWSAQVSSEVLSAPRAAQGIAIVRTGDGKITALDATNGQRKWQHDFALPALLLRSDSGVIITRNLVVAGLPGGRMLALNLASGAPVWETVIAQPKGANEIERITDIGATPVVDGEQACAVAYQGRVGCVDLAKGTLTWGRDASSASALGVDPITVYMTDVRGTVFAFDKQSGATLWKQEKLLNRGVTGPTVLGDFVVVGDFEGYVHVLDGDTGAFVARMKTDGSRIMAEPLRVGAGAVVQTQNGGLYAISVK